jgi:hypothetical protein
VRHAGSLKSCRDREHAQQATLPDTARHAAIVPVSPHDARGLPGVATELMHGQPELIVVGSENEEPTSAQTAYETLTDK